MPNIERCRRLFSGEFGLRVVVASASEMRERFGFSIISETFIVPSSAVTAEPLRPMTMTPMSSGPSSRKSETETKPGT